jgi:hypothetical protein
MANDLPAITNVFPDIPTMHANAHVLASFIFRDFLGIFSLLRDLQNFRHALA